MEPWLNPRGVRGLASEPVHRRLVARFGYEALHRAMSEFDASPFVLRSIAGGTLDAATLLRLGGVVPQDELREKRLANLKIARQVIVALNDDVPVGLVYVRTMAGIPNVTWLVAEGARRRGLAVRMLERLQEDWPYLTAICRNEVSVAVAVRSGFAVAGPFALWIRRRK